MGKISLTVIMPALNEEKNIKNALYATIHSLKAFNIDGEILVINDGSTDNTKGIVEEVMKEHSIIRLVNNEKRSGLGGAFWKGVDEAHGENVVVIPGDNENDSTEIFRYFDLLDHVDIVIPFVYNKEVRSLFRNILSSVYRLIINLTFRVNFNYTNGTVLYKRSILTRLQFRNHNFFFQTDILIRLVKSGYLFAEVPYRLDVREGGESSAVSFPSFLDVVKGYINLVKDHHIFKRSKKDEYHEQTSTAQRRNNSGQKEKSK